jgi:SAM-dependent methyltransferase
VIRTDHSLYRRAARREAATWGRSSVATLAAQRPIDHPAIQEFHRSLVVDDANSRPWVDWFAERFGPFRSALSLGCGTGLFEETLLNTGNVGRLHVVDISKGALRSFQDRLRERGLSTHFTSEAADLNEVSLTGGAYDLVLARNSLHHVINLEHVLEQIRQSLKRDGIFLLQDFVGPNAWQWPDVTIDEANRFIQSTRNDFRGLSFQRVKRPSARAVKAVSPFESVRSSEILDIVHTGFHAVKEVLTDRLLFVLANYGVTATEREIPRLTEWLELAVNRERELPLDSGLPPCTLFGVYRRGDAAIPEGAAWSEQQIRDRIGVSRVNAAGLALGCIEHLPCRDWLIGRLIAVRRRMGWY